MGWLQPLEVLSEADPEAEPDPDALPDTEPDTLPEALPELRGLKFLRSGLFLGEMKKNRFEPSQSLAMALSARDYKNCLNLTASDERTIRYLKGETLTLAPEESEGPDGWMLVCVDSYPLGWGKKLNFSLKNKYHTGWRLM